MQIRYIYFYLVPHTDILFCPKFWEFKPRKVEKIILHPIGERPQLNLVYPGWVWATKVCYSLLDFLYLFSDNCLDGKTLVKQLYIPQFCERRFRYFVLSAEVLCVWKWTYRLLDWVYISGEHTCHLVSRPLLPPQGSGLFLQGKYNTPWYLWITWNPNWVKLLSCNAIGISTLGQDSCLQEGVFCLYLGINMFLLEKCGHVSQKLGRFSGIIEINTKPGWWFW